MNDSQQHAAHGGAYAYAYAPYAEFYDLWVQELFGTSAEDAPVFAWYIQEALHHHQSLDQDELVILDLGAGTGRVLLDILAATPPASLCLIGVDHSPAMLARAAQKVHKALAGTSSKIPRIEFVEASATAYASHVRDAAQIAGADLVLFSAGSVAHLTSAGALRAFLQQSCELLRPRGRAIVSVLDDFFVEVGAARLPRQPSLDESVTLASADQPGTFFEKGSTSSKWDDACRVKTERFGVRQVAEDGRRVVWKRQPEWSLRGRRMERSHRLGGIGSRGRSEA